MMGSPDDLNVLETQLNITLPVSGRHLSYLLHIQE